MGELIDTRVAEPLNTEIRHKPALVWCVAIALILASGFLFLTHNGFSFRCHPDEPGKVQQIATHARNFNHPLLMLNTVQVVFDHSGMPPRPQNIARVGRTVTGVFAVLTVLTFAAAAYFTAGPLAALLCGVFLLEAPLLIEVAHYFKEDPAMLFGLGLSLLGITLYKNKPGAGVLAMMAVGAALSASGKHIGLAVLPFCVYAVWRQGSGWKPLAGFFGVAVAVYALVNYQIVSHFFGFLDGVDREMVLVRRGGGVPRPDADPLRPFWKYRATLFWNTPFPVLWFAAFGAWVAFREKMRPVCCAALFGLMFFLMLSLTPKTAVRYLLPVICMVCYVGAVGAARIWQKRSLKWRIGGGVLLVLAIGLALPRAYGTYAALKNDTRRQMAEWISQHLPGDAVIAQDHYGLLENTPDCPYFVKQPLFDAGMDVRKASFAALRAGGVRYVVVVHRSARGSPKNRGGAQREVAPADQLREHLPRCEKVWKSTKRIKVANVSPRVEIYRLPED